MKLLIEEINTNEDLALKKYRSKLNTLFQFPRFVGLGGSSSIDRIEGYLTCT